MTATHTGEDTKNMISQEQGADTPIYLALLPAGTDDIQGKFVFKRTVLNYFKDDIRPFIFE